MAFQPLIVWALSAGPNSWKVVTVLEELGVPYKINLLLFAEVKNPEFTAINPNGRVPAIQDPNAGGLILWESGAIIEYLIEKYDKMGKLSYVREEETELKWQTRQWLFFQASGQGPYFGQATWFHALHPEPLLSAQKRYENEILRIMSVLESALSKSTSGWLVGDKCTYADTSFMFWNIVIIPCMKVWLDLSDDWTKERFPHVHNWHETLLQREASARVIVQRNEATKKTWQADLEESQRQTGRKEISNPEVEGNVK